MNISENDLQTGEVALQWAGTGGGAGSKGALLGEDADQARTEEKPLQWAGTGSGAGSKGALLGELVSREDLKENQRR